MRRLLGHASRSRRSIRRVALALAALSWAAARPAAGESLVASSARALGMGGALRGQAAGSAAPFANPSGLAVVRNYVVEGGYHFVPQDSAHVAHLVLADNRTNGLFGLAPSYTFARAKPGDGNTTLRRHEAGLTMSTAFGSRVFLGATGKYLWTERETAALPMLAATTSKKKGFTFDAGLTMEATAAIRLGLVGYNLLDLESPHAPRAAGGGLTFQVAAPLLVAADMVVDFTGYDDTRGNVTTFMGGAEYHIDDWLALRAGGGYDGFREGGYGTFGLSLLSVERQGNDASGAALDLGFRQDLSGKSKTTFLGVSARLFIPVPEAQ